MYVHAMCEALIFALVLPLSSGDILIPYSLIYKGWIQSSGNTAIT